MPETQATQLYGYFNQFVKLPRTLFQLDKAKLLRRKALLFLAFHKSVTAISFCVNEGSYGTTQKLFWLCLVTTKFFPLKVLPYMVTRYRVLIAIMAACLKSHTICVTGFALYVQLQIFRNTDI